MYRTDEASAATGTQNCPGRNSMKNLAGWARLAGAAVSARDKLRAIIPRLDAATGDSIATGYPCACPDACRFLAPHWRTFSGIDRRSSLVAGERL